MPTLAPKPCRHTGCAELVSNGKGYCSKHLKEKYKEQDRNRLSPSKRGYGRKWQRIRKKKLMLEPWCLFCLNKDKHTPATEVDHIDGNSFNNSSDNLRSLCKSCHSGRTMKEQVNK
jgi:5-methylcytosine-specific restriction protein A